MSAAGSSPAKRMRAIARAAGDRVLIPQGFARKELRWGKQAAEGVEWVVEVEKEKHTHSRDEIGFTISWGVAVAGFLEVYYDEPHGRRSWNAALHGRITDLSPKARGGWWIVTTDGTSLFGLKRRPTDEQMTGDIAERLERDLLPFLAPLTSGEAVAALIEDRGDFLRKRGIWPDDGFRQLDHVAALRLLEGDVDGALALVETLRERAAAKGVIHRVQWVIDAIERKARELRGDL